MDAAAQKCLVARKHKPVVSAADDDCIEYHDLRLLKDRK
jgi:hypothetical protein